MSVCPSVIVVFRCPVTSQSFTDEKIWFFWTAAPFIIVYTQLLAPGGFGPQALPGEPDITVWFRQYPQRLQNLFNFLVASLSSEYFFLSRWYRSTISKNAYKFRLFCLLFIVWDFCFFFGVSKKKRDFWGELLTRHLDLTFFLFVQNARESFSLRGKFDRL